MAAAWDNCVAGKNGPDAALAKLAAVGVCAAAAPNVYGEP